MNDQLIICRNVKYSGQPVFAQIIGMINRSTFASLGKGAQCRPLQQAMQIMGAFNVHALLRDEQCTSLREVTHRIASI